MKARVAVLQFPGVNCETETVSALGRAGLSAEVFRWTRPASELESFDAFVLPGGFSYQDRVRAGAIAAHDELTGSLATLARAGRPVLGICNGAQILVEAGLVPGGSGVELALARNRMPGRTGYYARWIHVRVETSPCVYTRHLEPGTVLPLPVAHGEGRFTGAAGRMAALRRQGLAPLRYATARGAVATEFPDLPNGAEESAAAVCDARGLVLALMPHPERALWRSQVPVAVSGPWARPLESAGATSTDGPGFVFFDGLRRHLECA